MKKLHKILAAVLMATLVAALAVFAVGCSGGDNTAAAAKLTGIYNSDKKIAYSNFAPNQNYRYFTISYQTIETYDDGTYCLSVSSVGYSNVTFGVDVASGNFEANEKGTATTRYYGKLTVEDPTADDATYVLGKPTRVVSSKQGNYYIDTAVWNEKMADATRPTNPETGTKGDPLDKDTYLEQQLGAWKDGNIEVFMILSNSMFDFIAGINNSMSVAF